MLPEEGKARPKVQFSAKGDTVGDFGNEVVAWRRQGKAHSPVSQDEDEASHGEDFVPKNLVEKEIWR